MTSRTVERIVVSHPTSDGAGVRLNRSIGTPELDHVDPFLLLDEFRSDDPDDYIAGFPEHPHRGFETVTYMIVGRMRHEDSTGAGGVIGPGGVQWMTAGRGIVHSEMPEQQDGAMHGFQLWVNLPAADKMAPPRYQNIDPAEVPEVADASGARVRVIAGRVNGAEGPVRGIAVDPIYLDVALPAGGVFSHPTPADHAAFVYPFEGTVQVGAGGAAQEVERGRLAVLGPGDEVEIAAAGDGPARTLLVAGRPLAEPIARYGPFVMNSREEIMAAFEDFRAGRF